VTAASDPGPVRDGRDVVVAWATDIHLDHTTPDVFHAFAQAVRASGASALLLGGDISVADDIDAVVVTLADLVGMPVHFVLGNHDYYGGSVSEVRERLWTIRHPSVHWLPASGPCALAPGVALVGHGGWGDARLGDFAGSSVVLTDYVAIAELSRAFDLGSFHGVFGTGTRLETELRSLGQDAADSLGPHLRAAAPHSRQVIVLTHVPPFREACWHEGRISSDDFLPGFACGAVGDVLREAAAAHAHCRFTVLCGHTHSGGLATIADNLVVHTQAAEYESPGFVLLQVSAEGISCEDRP